MSYVYTASATIKYIMHRDKISLADISKIICADAEPILKGKRRLTKIEYYILSNAFDYLEGSIEYYENVKRLNDEELNEYIENNHFE